MIWVVVSWDTSTTISESTLAAISSSVDRTTVSQDDKTFSTTLRWQVEDQVLRPREQPKDPDPDGLIPTYIFSVYPNCVLIPSSRVALGKHL